MKSSMKSALPCAATLWPHPLSSSWRLLGERSLLWIQPVQKPAVKTVPAVTHTEESVASNNPKQRQTPEPCKCRSIKHIHINSLALLPASVKQHTPVALESSAGLQPVWPAPPWPPRLLACLAPAARPPPSLSFFLARAPWRGESVPRALWKSRRKRVINKLRFVVNIQSPTSEWTLVVATEDFNVKQKLQERNL